LDVKAGKRIVFMVSEKIMALKKTGLTGAKALAASLRQYAGERKTAVAVRSHVKMAVARTAAREPLVSSVSRTTHLRRN